ncbi:DUF3710 domain-containing protein [Streptomyces sp. NPDC059578]|uniref:DUF3710 domain-containing protein n=1 Tax=Streptomyces sp. NPDC059578 TaxID=3346874 RepID=UPI0036B069EE
MTHRPAGPWNISELPGPDPAEELVDLGGLLVPMPEEGELRVEVAEGVIVAATVVLGGSAVQLQAFAAPEDGAWEGFRAGLVRGIVADGGTAVVVPGTFGPEVRARVDQEEPDGTRYGQEVRFVGVDGPGWMLRGVFSGLIARRPGRLAGPLAETFRRTVVVPPGYPMQPEETIPLHLPEDTGELIEDPDPQGQVRRPRTRRPRLHLRRRRT